MNELSNWATVIDSPWKFLVGVAVLTLGPFALLSKETATEKFWLIGKLVTFFSKRKEKAADLEEMLSERRTQDLWAEIKRIDTARKEDKKRLTSKLERLEKSEQMQYEYILYVTPLWRSVTVWAENNGYVLPVRIMSYPEWLKERGGDADAVPVEGRPDVGDGRGR